MTDEKLKQKVEFYNPRQDRVVGGSYGIGLSKSLINTVASLDGQTMTLEEAMAKISPEIEEIDGTLKAVEKSPTRYENGIDLRVEDKRFSGRVTHFCTLINYK